MRRGTETVQTQLFSTAEPPPVAATPLKWFGGKRYVAPAVLEIMPRHLSYVEPFAGGLQVLFARDPADRRFWWREDSQARGVSEVVNDLCGHLTNFYRVLQGDGFERFRRMAEATPFSEAEFGRAVELCAREGDGDPVLWAWSFFVHARMSHSGMMKGFTGVTKSRTRGGRNNEVNAWWNCVEGLGAVHHRLRDVLVLNRDALEVIGQFDREDALLYLDPPYVHASRTAPEMYDHEMTDARHRELLALAKGSKAKVIISGYANRLYDEALAGWSRRELDLANHSGGGREKQRRTEVLWCNY